MFLRAHHLLLRLLPTYRLVVEGTGMLFGKAVLVAEDLATFTTASEVGGQGKLNLAKLTPPFRFLIRLSRNGSSLHCDGFRGGVGCGGGHEGHRKQKEGGVGGGAHRGSGRGGGLRVRVGGRVISMRQFLSMCCLRGGCCRSGCGNCRCLIVVGGGGSSCGSSRDGGVDGVVWSISSGSSGGGRIDIGWCDMNGGGCGDILNFVVIINVCRRFIDGCGGCGRCGWCGGCGRCGR